MASVTAARRGEVVQVPVLQNGLFPRAFIWRGQRHDIQAVVACHTENRQGRVRRHLFQVRTEGVLVELAQDLARGQWRVERAWGVE